QRPRTDWPTRPHRSVLIPAASGSETAGLAEIPEASDDGRLFVESGVVEQLLGLATGTEEARPEPSERALELLLAPAVRLTAKAIADHGPECEHPPTCPEVPPPL